jgi:mono/diheme cytochrome c family protein
MKKSGLIALTLGLLVFAGSARAAGPAGDPQRGKVVYQRYCVSCHGDLGNGNGEAAQWITPKPRDYRQGTFKCGSTPRESLPLSSDLEKTLANGFYGTYMPSWFAVGERSRRDVIAYIKTFSTRWRTETPQDPVPIPGEPPYTPESVKNGRAVYDQSGCAACHGERGLGDGSSRSLQDDWGNPINASDLTRGYLKCGNTGADLYRTLMTGVGGTPMPSFMDSMKPQEAWDLVHYIESLSPHYPKKTEPGVTEVHGHGRERPSG